MTDIGRANPKVLIGLWWAGVVSIVTFFIALWPMMGFIPPPAPTLTLQEYYDLIFDNAFLFRAGVIIVMISASLLLPITALMTYFIARMERGHTPLLAMTSFSAGIINALLTLLPAVVWAAIAYREDRNLQDMQMLNDIMWLCYLMYWQPFVIQIVAMGITTLNARTPETQIFPRWYGYYVLWSALAVCGGGIAVFFLDGPFAWNGLIGWWLVVIMFGLYWVVSFVVWRKAINKEIAEAHNETR